MLAGFLDRSWDEAVKLFMEEKVHPRAQLASAPRVAGQSFEMPAPPFQREQVTYSKKLD